MTSAGRLVSIAAVATVALASGCATARRGTQDARAATGVEVEVGLASYYGRAHHGKVTASGERFDMRAMTAAHRTHPFGSVLRVTDLETGRSVEVKVTDRGPFARDRIVDLSYAAAKALGILERGVARVRVERLE